VGWASSAACLGIDAAAHRGGLSGPGRTVAVIGTGADRIYPARNGDLARRIAAKGPSSASFPWGFGPLAHNFPRRNRLIAGLARGVLVVEAALKSGSLITARLAIDCGREVFAIPGSIPFPRDEGLSSSDPRWGQACRMCRRHTRGASLPCAGSRADTWHGTDPGDAGDDRVLSALGHDPVDVDTLVHRTSLTPEALSAILLSLELEGRVARLPGGRLQRL
jgi:DNA processing protein